MAELFKDKFSEVNGGQVDGSEIDNSSPLASSSPVDGLYISFKTVLSAQNSLKCGIDFTGLHTNHIKFLNDFNIKFIACFVNSCLAHNYVPTIMLFGEIGPRLKDKFGNSNASKNYREVMASTILFKLFEYCMVPTIKRFSKISPFQFGYREKTSPLLGGVIFKEIVNYYIDRGNSIYTCFLDMSKAFERVIHDKLLEKLTKKGFPIAFIETYRFIFKNSYVRVNYRGKVSDSWRACRGVRQGGISSPHFFSLYIDDILKEIHNEPMI